MFLARLGGPRPSVESAPWQRLPRSHRGGGSDARPPTASETTKVVGDQDNIPEHYLRVGATDVGLDNDVERQIVCIPVEGNVAGLLMPVQTRGVQVRTVGW